MKKEIQFTATGEPYFTNRQEIRAFIYTDYNIELHDHHFYELNIVLKGKGTHRIENACFEVKPGDVFFIPPKAAHAYYNTENMDVYHVLLFPGFILENMEEAAGMPGFLRLVEIEPFLRPQCHSGMFLHLSGGQLTRLTEALGEIADGGIFDTEVFLPFKKHAMWRILYWLSYLFSIQGEREKETRKYEQCIMNALEFMQQNYGEKITVDMVCRTVYLSRATFLRRFREICGMSPMQYLKEYRTRKAVGLLEVGALSKTEIAQKCGFYDLSHMERSLRQKAERA